jgi:hypothetical protein
MNTDIILDELISEDEQPDRQNARQKHGQSMQKIALKASGQTHRIRTKSFFKSNLQIVASPNHQLDHTASGML